LFNNGPNFSSTYFNSDKNIHCLKDEYWISKSDTESKYGLKKYHNLGVMERYYDGKDNYTPKNYMAVPGEFRYKSAYANFDLGSTSDTLYPAHHSMKQDLDHKLIDFGNNSFYFYGK